MKTLMPLLAVLLLATNAAAQEGPAAQDEMLLETARRLMTSKSHAVQAWGAYIAGRHRLDAAVPDLRALLHPQPGGSEGEASKETARLGRYVRHAALDALIRLEAEVPSNELLALPRGFKTHAFLLLAKEPEENQAALLDLIRSSSTGRACWMGACNLLVPLGTPGIAAFLLEGLHLKVELAVLDSDKMGGGSSGGVTFGDGSFTVPEGYPPITLYLLEEKRTAGSTLVADGNHPIYCLRRIVEPGGRAGTGSSSSRWENNEFRMEYLAQLAGVDPEDLGFKPDRHERIQWTDADDYRSEVNYIRTKVRKDFESFAEVFLSEGHLSPGEMKALKPPIEIKVHDLRDDKSVELPEVPSR